MLFLTRRAFHAFALTVGAFPISALGQEDNVSIRIRVDDTVQAKLPPILQQTLTITPDTSPEASALVQRVPPGRAIPVILIIVGALAVPVILQMVKELLRQTYYGGVLVETRSQPPSITSDVKIPANMVFVIAADGKTTEYTSSQITPDVLGSLLRTK
jgi:hypothetical protein